MLPKDFPQSPYQLQLGCRSYADSIRIEIAHSPGVEGIEALFIFRVLTNASPQELDVLIQEVPDLRWPEQSVVFGQRRVVNCSAATPS